MPPADLPAPVAARRPLGGLVAAVFTPMDAAGAVDVSAVPRALEHVLGQGADGAFICGSTGEAPSLTVAERRAVAEAYMAARDGLGADAPMVVHVGHNSLAEAADLAAHAESIGADAIGVVPPSYFPSPDLDGLVACLAEVAAAAPDTPLFYYHIPRLSRVGTRMVDLLGRAGRELPTLAGIKFSSFELDDLLRCVAFDGGRYRILFGSDEMLLAGLSMGAVGAVGSTYNFMGGRFRAVIDALEAGDLEAARRHQLGATRRIHAILAEGGANAIKAAMGILGTDCGPPRLPLAPLGPEATARLRASLARLDAEEAEGAPC